MSYDTHLHGPLQALTEFGRAAAAGVGLPINVVTPAEEGTSMSTRYPRRSRRTLFPSSERRVRRRTMPPSYGPTRSLTAASTMTPTRSTVYRHLLGRRVGAYKTRRTTWQGNKNNLLDKNLHMIRMIKVDHDANEDIINKRTAQLCKVHGVKFRMWMQFKNGSLDERTPLMVRWAVLNPKENTGVDYSLSTSVDDFFISENPGAEQTKPFHPAAGNPGNCFDFMNRKINREAWGVLKEGHFVLDNSKGVKTGSATKAEPTALKKLSFYIPVWRQMKWDSDGTGYPTQNLYFAYWYCKLGDQGAARAYSTSPIEDIHERTTYFTNAAMFR